MKKNKFSITKKSDPPLDEELWPDEIIKRQKALREGICINCKQAVDKSSMDIGHREIYEKSGLCPTCFEGIFKK